MSHHLPPLPTDPCPSEPWFHRNLSNGRSSAEQILKTCGHLGDGTFLVRPSETFVGDYSLSFFRRGEVYHVPIKIRQVWSSSWSRTGRLCRWKAG